MTYLLSDKQLNDRLKALQGDQDTPYNPYAVSTPTEVKQQGFFSDFIDSVQKGAYEGVGNLAAGVNALTGGDNQMLDKISNWAGKKADEQLETMSVDMRNALNKRAFGDENGDNDGISDIYWWAGNFGAMLGQNLDAVATLGTGKLATTGIKMAGKALTQEGAEQIGKAAVKEAGKRGIPAKYANAVGYSAIMGAMTAGSRDSQVREELATVSDEEIAKLPDFKMDYFSLRQDDQHRDKSDDEVFDLAREQFTDRAARAAALNPTAMLTDFAATMASGFGGGLGGIFRPAKTVAGGLGKGALIEAGTEAAQSAAEQRAVNLTAQRYYDPSRDALDGVAEAAAEGAVLGGAFGGVFGGVDTGLHKQAVSKQKRRIIEAVSTGNDEIDARLKAHAEMVNQNANDLDDLISMHRIQAMNAIGAKEARAKAVMAEAQAEAQAAAEANAAKQAVEPEQLFAKFQADGLTDAEIDQYLNARLASTSKRLSDLETNPFQMSDNYEESLVRKNQYQTDLEAAKQELAHWQRVADYRRNPQPAQEMGGSDNFTENDTDNQRFSRSAMKSIEANIKRGREAMTKAILDKATVHRAMYRNDLDGWIDFEWGDDGLTKPFNKKGEPVGKGIAHIFEARQRKDGLSYQQTSQMLVNDIVDTIAKGQIHKASTSPDGKEQKVQLDHKGYRAVLLKKKGNNGWILTAFGLHQNDGQRVGFDTTEPTHSEPTLTRQGMGAFGARLADNAFELYPTDVNQAGSVDTRETTHILPTLTRQDEGAVGLNQTIPLNNQTVNVGGDETARQVLADSGLGLYEYDRSIESGRNEAIQTATAELDEKYHNQVLFSLNENPNSDFARAVENVFNSDEKVHSTRWIELGTTPQALIQAGISDKKMLLSNSKLIKIKHDHPEMTAGLLKQIPRELNNPVAVFKNTKVGSPNNSYVVLTELQADNGESVIVALHADKTNRGLEFNKLASIYGRNESKAYIKNMVEKSDVRFVDTQKAGRISRELQLLSGDTLNLLLDRASVVKTEESVKYQDKEIRRRLQVKLGRTNAAKIQLVSRQNPPQGANIERLISDGVEGWFDGKTGNITLVAESIQSTDTMSRDDRLLWVAWHELAHRGVNVHFKGRYSAVMQQADRNSVVRTIADRIQQERKHTDDLAATNRDIAVEEAIAELYSAFETGNYDELRQRYGANITRLHERNFRAWFDNLAVQLREFFAKLFGKERADTFSNQQLIGLLKEVRKGIAQEEFSAADTRHSVSESEANKQFMATAQAYGGEAAYRQAKAEGKTELDYRQWVQVRTPAFKEWFGDWENDPDEASKMINPRTGEPLVVYHGTPNGNFSIFNGESYFSPSEEYAARYQHPSASSIGSSPKSADNPTTYAVYLDIKKPFDTRIPEVRAIFERDFFRKWGNGTPLSESGLPDWTDATDLLEFIEENELDFDGLILDEGADGGYGAEVVQRGLSYVPINANQIKSATDNTGAFSAENEDIRFNRRPKSESLAKLRQAKPIHISGTEIKVSDDLKQYRRNVMEYGKGLRGSYINKDTGQEIDLSRASITEVLHHDLSKPEHLQSIAAIPQIIENATYISTLPNEDVAKNPTVREYEYYVAGLNIGGIDYTVKAAVGVGKDGSRYYDHKLTQIEKGKLLSLLDRLSNAGASEANSPLSAVNDKRLLQILQADNSAVRYSRAAAMDKLGLGKEQSVFEQASQIARQAKDKPVSEWKTWAEDLGKRANAAIFDALAPLKYAEDEAGITDHTKSAYTAARLAAGSASITEAAMLHGLPEFDKDGFMQRKQGTGSKESLVGIMEGLGSDVNDFLGWVAGNRAEQLMREGRENNLNQADIAYLKELNRGKEAKFEAARKKLQAWNTAILDLAERSGLLSPAERAKFGNNEFYIPFYREDDDGDPIAPYRKSGLANQNSGIRKLKGSDKATSDLLSNLISNASKVIDASVKNMAMTKAVTNLVDTQVISEISTPTMMDYRQLNSRNGNKLMVKLNGEERMFDVHDQGLFNALTNIDQKPMDYPMRKIFSGAKRLLTATVTSMPDFMVRNFLRDIVQAATTDRNGMKLGIDSLKGLKKAYAKDGVAVDLMFSGATFGAGYVDAGDPQRAADKIRNHLRKKGLTKAEVESYMQTVIWSKDQLIKVFDKYREAGSAIENANRIAVYQAALAAGKSRAQAALEAKDLMDFSMHGNAYLVRLLGDVLPFFNARLQGLSQLGRALKDNPRKVALRGMTIAAASVMLAAMNAGNPAYEGLPDEEKDNYWHLFIGGEHFHIPKPFEIGVIFGTVPERLFRTMAGQDSSGQFADRVLAALGNTFALNPTPQAVKPLAELYSNKNMFTGRAIETMSDQRLLAKERYDQYTSLTARLLGEWTESSPKKIEHLVRGYFGTLGMYVLGMSDRVVRTGGDYAAAPHKYWHEYPVLSAVFGGDVNVPPRYTAQMNDFYDYLNEANEIAATAKSYEDDGRKADALALRREHAALLRHRPALSATQTQLRQIKTKMEHIHNSRTFDSRQKREALDRLQRQQNALVSRVVERMRAEDF